MDQVDEKTAKNRYIFVPSCQNHVSKSKSHSLNAAHDQKNFLANTLVHTAI